LGLVLAPGGRSSDAILSPRKDASIAAAQRADELLNEGDLDGAAVWKRILHAVEELKRTKPRVGELVN